jgi:hypothetical protein
MAESSEVVTNTRALVFGLGCTITAASFGAQVSNWPHWITIGSGYAVGLVLVLMVVWVCAKTYLSIQNTEGERSLEIIFEPLNPARKFWSMEAKSDFYGRVAGPYWEYRMEIKNGSNKTIRNVAVTVARIGASPEKPRRVDFVRLSAESCDLQPGCSELAAIVRWPIPKIQVGMLAGPSAWG